MLINFSNHPFEKWSEAQKRDAESAYVRIEDYPFPAVPTSYSTGDIVNEARKIADMIVSLIRQGDSGEKNAVMCQGEFTLAFAVTRLLQKSGISVIGAVSDRIVREHEENGAIRKELTFVFAGFREYPVL